MKQIILSLTFLCVFYSLNAFNGGCIVNNVDAQQGACVDGFPELIMFFDITGDCTVTDVCFLENGLDIGCADVSDLLIGNGQGINFGSATANAIYDFEIILSDGSIYDGFSFQIGNCDETICDCAGTEHSIGVLSWLGDTFADNGGTEFLWEGNAVDFDCETWGYDCGDIAGAPVSDPFDVCNGGLPPNNGCAVQECDPISLELSQGICSDDNGDGTLTPVINMTFAIDGDCMVDELCFSEDGGENFDCIDLPSLDQIVFNGGGLNLINTIPDAEYMIYFTIGNNTSSVYTFLNGNCDEAIEGCTNPFAANYNSNATAEDGSCIYDENICDCAGISHTIGVLTWLGDTFADEGGFLWDNQPVDFNCSNWGYDCGDIIDAPLDDPYNVCNNGLPPNNGCDILGECNLAIGTIEEECLGEILYHDIFFEITPECSFSELCYSINGGNFICEDISWLETPIYSIPAPALNSEITYYVTTTDDVISNDYVIFSGDCSNTDTCLPGELNITQGTCSDDNLDGIVTPTIDIQFEIFGQCLVQDLCFSIDGGEYTCYALADFEILVGNGEGINLINSTPDAEYSIYFTTEDGISSIYTFMNGNCEGVISGCTNEYADNYNPDALVEDGTCIYSETICDCAGTSHTIGVLIWLGDGFEDIGGTEFFWDGLPVDFNCSNWGYDCGDIIDSPLDDPFNVCDGGLPPNNGCEEGADCIPYDLTLEEDCLYDEATETWIPRVLVTGFFPGDCVVTEVCEEGTLTAETCFFLTDFDIFLNSGEGVFIPVQGNDTYTITLSTPDGVISDDIFISDCSSATFGCTNPYASNYDPDADDDDGTCEYAESICDCAGVSHTIGVLVWLGDGFADIGDFQWEGQNVDFNCAVWGYDCGDIEGQEGDPYNVCFDGLPPDNGCGIIEEFGCTDDEALNYDPNATVDDGTCEYEEQIFGCTDPEASNYNPNANVDNGTCEYNVFGCTDPEATNYNPLANLDNGTCIYVDIEGCTDPNANNYDPFANVDDGSCTYGCLLPEVIYEVYCDEEDLTGFYIDFEVSNVGTGVPYEVVNNLNAQNLILTSVGTFTFGPFENGESVVISFNSIETPNCNLISEILTENCNTDPILGCTDEEALNFQSEATEDDGSCVYDCVYPIIEFSTVCEEGEDDVFYVEMDIEDLGNSAPYHISNNIDDETLSINFEGVISLGPYTNGSQVLYSLESEIYEACSLTSPVLMDDCSPEIIEGCTDPLAVNYDALATIDDGSCEYDFQICDCVGNVYSPSVLSQLGDGTPNDNIVNFNCETWGYDCGDIPDAPDEDPNGVCEGNLPPLFGCPDFIESEELNDFIMFPNPASTSVTIQMQNNTGCLIEIYNSLGELVLSTIENEDQFELDIKHISTGVYILKVIKDSTKQEQKLIIK